MDFNQDHLLTTINNLAVLGEHYWGIWIGNNLSAGENGGDVLVNAGCGNIRLDAGNSGWCGLGRGANSKRGMGKHSRLRDSGRAGS